MTGELILIIEDNQKNLKLIRDLLQFKGYATLEAETGEAGVELARERHPALILYGCAASRDGRACSYEGLKGRRPHPAHSDPRSDGVCHERGQRGFTG